MRIKRKILSVPAGDADRRPLRELHQGKRETANTATSVQDTRGCQATLFRAEKRVTPRWAGGWTRALKGRAATSGGFWEAQMPELRVREGRATTGTEFRGGVGC